MNINESKKLFLELTPAEYKQFCVNFQKKFQDMTSEILGDYPQNWEELSKNVQMGKVTLLYGGMGDEFQVYKTVQGIFETLQQLDFHSLKSRKKISRLVFNKLYPLYKRDSAQYVLNISYSYEFSHRMRRKYAGIAQKAAKMLAKNIDSDSSTLFKNMHIFSPLIKLDEAETPFPELTSRINDVQQLILLTHTQMLSVEDSYIVDKIRNEHLPYIALTSRGFKQVNPELQKSAVQQYQKQLTVMENKLQLIIDNGAKNLLKDNEVQTEFLAQTLTEECLFTPNVTKELE